MNVCNTMFIYLVCYLVFFFFFSSSRAKLPKETRSNFLYKIADLIEKNLDGIDLMIIFF
jgi:hypothetical protein